MTFLTSLGIPTLNCNLPTCFLCGHLSPQSSGGCSLLGRNGDGDSPLIWWGSMLYSLCSECCAFSSAQVDLVGWNYNINTINLNESQADESHSCAEVALTITIT